MLWFVCVFGWSIRVMYVVLGVLVCCFVLCFLYFRLFVCVCNFKKVFFGYVFFFFFGGFFKFEFV